jgi:hypothetical protein
MSAFQLIVRLSDIDHCVMCWFLIFGDRGQHFAESVRVGEASVLGR